jgi:hypothetical protein
MSNCLYCNVEGAPVCHPCLSYVKHEDKEMERSIKAFELLLKKMKKDCDELEEALHMLKE